MTSTDDGRCPERMRCVDLWEETCVIGPKNLCVRCGWNPVDREFHPDAPKLRAIFTPAPSTDAGRCPECGGKGYRYTMSGYGGQREGRVPCICDAPTVDVDRDLEAVAREAMRAVGITGVSTHSVVSALQTVREEAVRVEHQLWLDATHEYDRLMGSAAGANIRRNLRLRKAGDNDD